MVDVILKRFEDPDEVIRFDKGEFETVELGDMTTADCAQRAQAEFDEET